ncbi:MAG: hypothetical protein HUK05_04080 [Prevotella sp.]|nr:hypothetical protein [Prevotella sp.]
MKKLLLFAMMLLNMTTIMAQKSGSSDNYIKVGNAEDLALAIAKNPSAKIQLTADIDATKLRRICRTTFGGTITGKHKVYSKEQNDSVDAMYAIVGNGEEDEKTWLFDKVEGATFDNIIFRNFVAERDVDNLGIIAPEVVKSTFSNLVFKNISIYQKKCNAGVIAGKATDCKFKNITVKYSTVIVDDRRAGGLVGISSNSTFNNCAIYGTTGVYAIGSEREARVGGIVGESEKDCFEECENIGFICGRFDYLGGIAGRCKESKFTGCINQNMIISAPTNSNDKYAFFEVNINRIRIQYSSIKVHFEENAPIEAVIPIHNLIMLDDVASYDKVAGICGYAEKCEFERCTNKGRLYTDDKKCGGIVGFAKGGKINNCLNAADLFINQRTSQTASKTLGGIVGRVEENTIITNCLSTQDFSIIGTGSASSLSINNYRLENEDDKNNTANYEILVDLAKIANGTVARWLNNGVENRELAAQIWRQNLQEDKDAYPVLDTTHNEVTIKDLPHMTIKSEADLFAFAKKVNDGDVFLNAIIELDNSYNGIVMKSGEDWKPIGTKENRWRGVFDGQGKSIYNLNSIVNGEEGSGLFGTIDIHAEIHNVSLGNTCHIIHEGTDNRNSYGAGLVGNVRNNGRAWGNIIIRGCGNYGAVTASHHAGGILGRVINDNDGGKGGMVQIVVDSCFNSGVILADGNSGLLCGYMQTYGVVKNCWSNGSLKHRSTNPKYVFDCESPQKEAEYFVGYDPKLTISNCFDYNSDVDWDNFDEAKRYQIGVTKADGDRIVNINDGDGKPFTNKHEYTAVEINYTRKFNNTNFQALYIPFELDYEDWCEDFDIYKIESFRELDKDNDGEIESYILDVTRITSGSIKANMPYVIKAKEVGEKTFKKENATLYAAKINSVDCATTHTRYFFRGNYAARYHMKSSGLLALSRGELCPAETDSIPLGAYRWYLEKNERSVAYAPQIKIFVQEADNDATGINTVGSTLDLDNSCSDIYTISGQKVNSKNMPTGLYIKNGKKIIKK